MCSYASSQLQQLTKNQLQLSKICSQKGALANSYSASQLLLKIVQGVAKTFGGVRAKISNYSTNVKKQAIYGNLYDSKICLLIHFVLGLCNNGKSVITIMQLISIIMIIWLESYILISCVRVLIYIAKQYQYILISNIFS